MSRESESFEVDLGRAMKKELFKYARLLDSPIIVRHVDEEAVTKSLYYGQYKKAEMLTKRMIEKGEDYYQMEKARDTQTVAGQVDARSFPLDMAFEKLYFDKFGRGYNGTTTPSRPGEPWECPDCHMVYKMNMKLMRPTCKGCGRLTPLGEIQEEGIMKRA